MANKQIYVGTIELARALDVDPRTVRRAVKDGRLPAAKPGLRNLKFDPQAVRVALSNKGK